MTDPNCPWCHGFGFLTEEVPHQPNPNGDEFNCQRCNPYGTLRQFTDAEMDAWVMRDILPPDVQAVFDRYDAARP
jgi:protein-disulfide isomerase-like protein with CxxC motif